MNSPDEGDLPEMDGKIRLWGLPVRVDLTNLPSLGPGGEIGRRSRFRFCCPQGCAGSSPVPGIF